MATHSHPYNQEITRAWESKSINTIYHGSKCHQCLGYSASDIRNLERDSERKRETDRNREIC